MSNSSLVTYTNLTRNHSGRRTQPITKIAIHHMYAIWTGRQCADYFAATDRQASSNYCIGVDGDIAMSVEEANRAWTTSSEWCDQRAVTIEVANTSLSGDTPISGKSLDALIKLCLDICERNGIKECTFTGDKNGVLQMHKWYAATSCPGVYLGSKFLYIAQEVTKRLDILRSGGKTKPIQTSPTYYNYPPATYEVLRAINSYEKPDGKAKGKVAKGTKVKAVKELRSGVNGVWLQLDDGRYIQAQEWRTINVKKIAAAKPTPAKKSIAEIVAEVKAGKWGNGEDRKKRLTAAGYSYSEIQAGVNASYNQPAGKTADQIAQEVIDGKWGVYPERKQRLEAAGYNYHAVQNIVNRKLGYKK